MKLGKKFLGAAVLSTVLSASAFADTVIGVKGGVAKLIDPITGCKFNAVDTFEKLLPEPFSPEEQKRDNLIERIFAITRDKKDGFNIRRILDSMEEELYKKHCGDWLTILLIMEREVEKLEVQYIK